MDKWPFADGVVEDQEVDTGLLHSRSTLWICPSCKAFVSIHIARVVEASRCPLCVDVDLLLCGRFDQLLAS